MIPGIGYYIMNTIDGLNEELSQLALTPLMIISEISQCGKKFILWLLYYIEIFYKYTVV